jgi:hypothetical protein
MVRASWCLSMGRTKAQPWAMIKFPGLYGTCRRREPDVRLLALQLRRVPLRSRQARSDLIDDVDIDLNDFGPGRVDHNGRC